MKDKNIVTFIGSIKVTNITQKNLFKYLTEWYQYEILGKLEFSDGLYYCINTDIKIKFFYPIENFVIGNFRDEFAEKYNLI